MVYVIRSRIPGKAHHLEMAFPGKAQLLHPARAPAEHGMPFDAQGSRKNYLAFCCRPPGPLASMRPPS